MLTPKIGNCPGLACPRALDGDLCCLGCPANQDKVAYQSLKLELPFPPSVNHYWRHVVMGRSPRTLISAAGRAFRAEVGNVVLDRRAALNLAGPLSVAVKLYPPDKRRRDLDNFGGKALLDALTNAGVWRDDSLVKRLLLEWGPVVNGGRADVEIRRIV